MEPAAEHQLPDSIKPGMIWIKKQFLVSAAEVFSRAPAADEASSDTAATAGKRPADSTHSDASAPKKKKGQNKHRPRMARQPRSAKLCRFLWAMTREDLKAAAIKQECASLEPTTNGAPHDSHVKNENASASSNVKNGACNGNNSGSKTPHPLCEYSNCDFLHDVNEYLATKLPDIGEKCHNFLSFGKCFNGLTCRFGSEHIKDGFNVVNHELWNLHKDTNFALNSLPKDVQTSLRKKKYVFQHFEIALKKAESDKSQQVISSVGSNGAVIAPVDDSSTIDSSTSSNTSVGTIASTFCSSNKISSATGDVHKISTDAASLVADVGFTGAQNIKLKIDKIGPASDEDLVKLRPDEKRKVIWKDQLYLAPLTTLGNLPFRRICRRLGADITCGEMAVATNLLQGHPSEWALVKRHHTESVFGVQVCGSSPVAMLKCAELLSRTIDVDFVDINVGCPIDLIYKQGGGSALMRRQSALELMVRGMTSVLHCPLTVKMRTSIYMGDKVAHVLAPRCRDWGADMVTVHGRSREQRYTKTADWDYIRECVAAAAPMPVFGNGDVLSYEDYNMSKQLAGVEGVMIGRGALMKPWIFTEIKEQRHWDISSSERFQILKEFVNNGLEHWGSDSEGVEKTRNFLLEWLSFLCRYIPYGLLERPPQTMNLKPPFYVGRDELETLLASRDSRDWIKISEMLLGPVPENFAFLPKHKANSWS